MPLSFDAFLCHASPDKETVARPLARELTQRGYRIWFDEQILEAGVSLRKAIDKGLAHANVAIVVLSPSFFGRRWAEWELNGIVHRHLSGAEPFLLPIWHDVEADDVRRYSLSLADIVAIKTGEDIRRVAEQIAAILRRQTHDVVSSELSAADLEALMQHTSWPTTQAALFRILNLFTFRLRHSRKEPSSELHFALWMLATDGDSSMLIPVVDNTDYLGTGLRLPLDGTLTGRAVQTNEQVLLTDVQEVHQPTYANVRFVDSLKLRSMACVPLSTSSDGDARRVVAALNLYSTEPNQFDTELVVNNLRESSTWLGIVVDDLVHAALRRLPNRPMRRTGDASR